MTRPLVLLAAAAAAAAALVRRRHTQTEAASLWREATADASR